MKRIIFFICLVVCSSSCATYYHYQSYIENQQGASYTRPEELVSGNDQMALGYTLDGNILVTNKTDDYLIIDRAKSFLLDGYGSHTLFDNSTVTQSHSSTGGGAINLGAVASSLGVGGPVGTLASGINLGNAATNTTTITTQDQRFVLVPPHGQVYITGKRIEANRYTDTSYFQYLICYGFDKPDASFDIMRDNIMFKCTQEKKFYPMTFLPGYAVRSDRGYHTSTTTFDVVKADFGAIALSWTLWGAVIIGSLTGAIYAISQAL